MSDTRFYDSQLAFQGGMQGGFDPGHVADDQFFRGVNVSIREGIITCRPSFNEINLDFSGLEFNENTLAAAQAAYDAALADKVTQQNALTSYQNNLNALKTLVETDTTKTFANTDAMIEFCSSINNALDALQGLGPFYKSLEGLGLNITDFGFVGHQVTGKPFLQTFTPKSGATITENMRILLTEGDTENYHTTDYSTLPAVGTTLTQQHVDDLKLTLLGTQAETTTGTGFTNQIHERSGTLSKYTYEAFNYSHYRRFITFIHDFLQNIDYAPQTDIFFAFTPFNESDHLVTGNTITGQTSGAIGTVTYEAANRAYVKITSGTFVQGELLHFGHGNSSHQDTLSGDIINVADYIDQNYRDLTAIAAFHHHIKETYADDFAVRYFGTTTEYSFGGVTIQNKWAQTEGEFQEDITELNNAIANADTVITQKLAILNAQFDGEIVFRNGKFQGSAIYETDNTVYSVSVISGHIFLVNLENFKVSILTNSNTQLNEYKDRVFMVQAEQHFIVQDGIHTPKILTGSAMRDADHSIQEIPVGTNMAYGQGRLCVQISTRHFRIGDIHLAFDPLNVLKFKETQILNEGGGFTVSGKLGEIVSLQFANVADTSTGDGPLLAICQNGFSTFAINNPRSTWSNIPIQKVQLLGTTITGPDAYTNINEDILYRSPEGIRSYAVGRGEAESGFRYTEMSREVEPYIKNDNNTDSRYLSMAFFDKRLLSLTSPLNLKARSTKYDDALADYTTKRIASIAIDSTITDDNIRAKWREQLVSIESNTTTWTVKGTSTKDQAWVDAQVILAAAASTDFEKEYRIQALVDEADSDQTNTQTNVNTFYADYEATKYLNAQVINDVTYKGIISFDFSLYGYTKSTKQSTAARIKSGAYDGLWTGLNALQIFTVTRNGVKTCFAYTKHTTDGSPNLNTNRLYEITSQITGYDNSTTEIEQVLETRAMPHKTQRTYIDSPFIYKHLDEVTCWLDNVHDDVQITLAVKSDVIETFTDIGTLNLKAKTSSVNNPLEVGAPQSRAMIRLKDFTEQYESTTNHPIRNGNEFQYRLTWTGLMQLRRFLSSAREIAQPKNVNIETEKNTYPVDTYDQFRYSSN